MTISGGEDALQLPANDTLDANKKCTMMPSQNAREKDLILQMQDQVCLAYVVGCLTQQQLMSGNNSMQQLYYG